MLSTREPADMSDTERLEEVASLLAAGIQRLRARRTVAAAQDSASLQKTETGPDGLEVSSETRLSVTRG